MRKVKDITGNKFYRLTAIKFAYKKNNVHFWKFKCDCGKEIVARKNAVTSGQIKSCGCLHLEKVSKRKCNDFITLENYTIMIVFYKNKKLEVLIDNDDVEKIRNIGKWHAILDKTLKNTSFYICNRGNGAHAERNNIRLHRFIMNCPKDKVIDHINHNTLDNRKCNLKICTIFENQQNLTSKKTEQTGVYQRQKYNYWVSNITFNGKRYYKEFKTKDEAIKQRKYWENLFYNKGGDE